MTTQGTTDEDCDVHGLTPLIDGTLQIPIYLYFNWSPSDAYDANFLSGRPLTLYIYDNLTFDERPTASPEEKVFDDVFDAEKTMREMVLTCQIRDGVGTVFFDVRNTIRISVPHLTTTFYTGHSTAQLRLTARASVKGPCSIPPFARKAFLTGTWSRTRHLEPYGTLSRPVT